MYLVAVLIFSSCMGATGGSGAAPTASIPLPSLTISTDIAVPSTSSSSMSLTTGNPRFSITETPISDGVLATLYNLSRPLADDNNLVGVVQVANGKAVFEITSGLVEDGDLLLIKAGNMWQVVVFRNPDNSDEITLEPTNLYTSLAYQNLKNFWNDNGIDTSDVTAIDILDQDMVELRLDEECFDIFMETAVANEISETGLRGQIAIVTALFWIAQVDESFDYAAIVSEFFQSGSWSDETANALIASLGSQLGLSSTDSLTAVWQSAANAVQTISDILGDQIAKQNESGENNYCSLIKTDDSDEFVEQSTETMFSVEDVDSFYNTFGDETKFTSYITFLEKYQDPDNGDWFFEERFEPEAVAIFMKNWFEDDSTVDFDPDELYDILGALPEPEADGENYDPDFYRTWASAMYETYEDVVTNNTEFDPFVASTYWTMQIFGAGLTIEDSDVSDFDYYSTYNDFYTDYNSASGYGSYEFNDCLMDPDVCKSLYDTGGTPISDPNFGYDNTLAGGNYQFDYVCGDAICEDSTGENNINCPFDCFVAANNTCGDSVCDTGESVTCSIDCSANSSGSQTGTNTAGGNATGSGAITVDLNGTYFVSTLIDSGCQSDWINLSPISISGNDTTYYILSPNYIHLTLFSDTACHASDSINGATSSSCNIIGDGSLGTRIHVEMNAACKIKYEKVAQ